MKKSVMADHSINFGHCIQSVDTSFLAKKSGQMEHIINEPTVTASILKT
jgi:hypothetical protein